ncbi:MAG: GNAT family N-acetyltransferase [Candidatus Heimdallarchaeota archaeon]|nr:GNAT family N-acetyltransferase [Candidatus Heimdallarchaeota archaeon]MBY8996075.1 GNAT family N-acetyltransferase [Candidatus Heimdallarchaeota archaeon]
MTELEIGIRKVQKKDYHKVIKISIESFPEEDAEEIIKSLFDREHFYVAELVGKEIVVGFVAFGIYSIKTTHIKILAVDLDYRRKGIGSKLLERTIEISEMLPINLIRLEVRLTNNAAIKFYERYGFRIINTIEQYYDDMSDAYLMARKIKKT